MPTPRPINRQFLRCLAVASRRRGNHSSGAETCLPSARVTTRESLVKETCTASAAGLTDKVLIPRNYKLLAMLFNHFSDSGQFMVPESSIFRQGNRLQPIFGIFVAAFNMDMRRLI